MASTVSTISPIYLTEVNSVPEYDAELEPYASLFLKPLTNKKSVFSKMELEVMCKDPMHSPRLIQYLIDFVKNM